MHKKTILKGTHIKEIFFNFYISKNYILTTVFLKNGLKDSIKKIFKNKQLVLNI